jgi:dTDP-4-amino-4,6-dideoxygalactose transaminase
VSATVPYFDLAGQYDELRDEVLEALDRVSRSAQFVLGEEVAAFEREFAEYCGVAHCVALNSGTSALHLGLLAAGVGPGDEVVTSPNTFVATAEAISYTGATPVFADVLPETGNVDPAAVERVLTARTRAIVAVHLYGRPAALGPLLELASRHGVALVEDACQAHGARYRSRRVGAFGLAGAFSFYPGKNLGAYGEGGALTTDDVDVAALARTLRDHGQTERYRHGRVGFNYRMDGFQGAVLRIKLRRLDGWNARRRELAALYRELLAGADVELPDDDPADETAYHVLAAWVDDRDGVRAALDARGVATGIHYPVPVHLQPAYASLGLGRGSFPHAERCAERELSLPLFPELGDEQVRTAAAALAEVTA